jgi:hypothetical protein
MLLNLWTRVRGNGWSILVLDFETSIVFSGIVLKRSEGRSLKDLCA